MNRRSFFASLALPCVLFKDPFQSTQHADKFHQRNFLAVHWQNCSHKRFVGCDLGASLIPTGRGHQRVWGKVATSTHLGDVVIDGKKGEVDFCIVKTEEGPVPAFADVDFNFRAGDEIEMVFNQKIDSFVAKSCSM